MIGASGSHEADAEDKQGAASVSEMNGAEAVLNGGGGSAAAAAVAAGAAGAVDGGILDDEDNFEAEMFMEVVRRVETLEKLKNGLDEREVQLKQTLRAK